MPVLGVYSRKEVIELESAAKMRGYKSGYREATVEKQREINTLIDENETKLKEVEDRYGKVYGEMLLEQLDIEKKLEYKQVEVDVLRTVLVCETDKEVKRLEYMAKKTKKPRIKKKIENRIIDYKMRKIAYEAK